MPLDAKEVSIVQWSARDIYGEHLRHMLESGDTPLFVSLISLHFQWKTLIYIIFLCLCFFQFYALWCYCTIQTMATHKYGKYKLCNNVDLYHHRHQCIIKIENSLSNIFPLPVWRSRHAPQWLFTLFSTADINRFLSDRPGEKSERKKKYNSKQLLMGLQEATGSGDMSTYGPSVLRRFVYFNEYNRFLTYQTPLSLGYAHAPLLGTHYIISGTLSGSAYFSMR